MMKLVAFADVHGAFEVVTRRLQQEAPVDVAIVAGDLTTCGTPAAVERAIQNWRPLATHLFAVAGNMDSPEIDAMLAALGVSLDATCRRVGAAAFFGCSAAPLALGTPYEIAESEIAARIERGFALARGASQQVFVPHAPPFGAVDTIWSGESVGSRAVRAFVEREHPSLVVCGHIHEARGTARLGSSLIVNCGEAAAGHYAVLEPDAAGWRVRLC